MKYCVHCGSQLDDKVEICMNCGCLADDKCVVAFQRASQWFLINPPINIEITGEGYWKTLQVENGDTVKIALPKGKYKIHFFSSGRSTDCTLNLTQNTTYHLSWHRVSGKLEAWEI